MQVKITFPEKSDHRAIWKQVIEKTKALISWIGDQTELDRPTVKVDILLKAEEAEAAFKKLGCQVS